MISVSVGGVYVGSSHVHVVLQVEDFGFLMDMRGWCCFGAARGCAECGILCGLKFVEVCVAE